VLWSSAVHPVIAGYNPLNFHSVLGAALAVAVLPLWGWTGPRARPRERFRDILAFAAGLTPCFLCLLVLKLKLAPANDLFQDQRATDQLKRLFAPWRHRVIWEHTVDKMLLPTVKLRFDRYELPIPIPRHAVLYLLPVYVAVAGVRRPVEALGLWRSAVALAAIVAGYYFAYLISPFDLHQHVPNSVERLFIQVWPSLLLLVFLVARTPEEVFAASSARVAR
jgi:hypothetical protein